MTKPLSISKFNHSMSSAKLLITAGEPAGIGPELVVKVAQHELNLPLTVVGDPQLFSDIAKHLGLGLDIHLLSAADSPKRGRATLNVIPLSLNKSVTPGKLDTSNADYVLSTLKLASDLCLDHTFDAIVTGPVQKSVINDAGFAFSGHTEFFAERCAVNKVVMMLSTEGLRVALATTHLPLRDVADAITRANLKAVLDILITELHGKFGISRPKILVAGLNPHAGENGHLGSEEQDIIIPVLSSYTESHVQLVGPLPADTLFTPKYLEDADAVLAMYHDQGLPVLKHKGFGSAVNITLGLPYVRTSVDHGTALDLAGKGVAEKSSFLQAIKTASEMATAHSLENTTGKK